MAMECSLEEIWKLIEDKSLCNGCPLIDNPPLLFKVKNPWKIKAMFITEGPNRVASREFIASVANHPTYTFLSSITGCKFRPMDGEGVDANAYWTHVRKCFLKPKNAKNRKQNEGYGQQALKKCAYEAKYLLMEIEALKPKLIVAVGGEALKAVREYSGSKDLEGNLKELILKRGGIFHSIKIGSLETTVIVLPHPSGRNPFWNSLPDNAREIFEKIKSEIESVL